MNCPILDKARDFSNYDFWYYTSYKTAGLILENHCFYSSNLDEMNDINEKERHRECSSQVHLLCFCNSNTEKIPMWYLYAGLFGNGVSIGFTPKTMMDFIKSIKKVSDVKTGQELLLDKDFELRYGWVYYQNNTNVSFRNKWYQVSDTDTFVKDNYFIKDYPWEYEREFRIVLINKTASSFKQIKIDIPEKMYTGIKCKVAPETTPDFCKREVAFQKAKKIYPSTLKVKMDLCRRNQNEIYEYCANNANEDETEKICACIRNRQMCKSK